METQDEWDGGEAMNRPLYYILNDDHSITPAPVEPDGTPSSETILRVFGGDGRMNVVKQGEVGDHWVSTVFLGINHGFDPDEDPLLFETMVFDKERHGGDMERYSTWDDALAGHEAMVERVKKEMQSGLTRRQLEKGKKVIEGLLKDE